MVIAVLVAVIVLVAVAVLVPVVMANAPGWVKGLGNGRLSDVAPTLLTLMGLSQPEQMTGQSLIEPEGQ